MKICIDPGHGGYDPGAVETRGSTIALEKSINLSASFMLAGVLNSFGYIPVLTRMYDLYNSLKDRVAIADNSKSALFISVHCNSFDQPEPRGFEVYHFPSSSDGEKVAHNILDQASNVSWLHQHGDGCKESKFYVLRYTHIPAVLVELSFLSNQEDLKNLLKPECLFELMHSIGKGIHESLTTSS